MASEIKSARDALVEIVNKLEPIVTYMKPSEEDGLSTVYAACEPIYDIAQAALALPRRNFEVGTAEEQVLRWRGFCAREKGGVCDDCPCLANDGVEACYAKWAQMPYEAENGGAE